MSFERLTRHGHKMYANLAGYFWLPCDWCGFEFGGHEEGWKSRPVGTNEPLLCFRCAPNYIEGRGRGHLGGEPMNNLRWNDRDERGRHWNGQRWVTHGEWTTALRIRAYATWRSLPWYTRLFTKNPRKEN